MDKDRKGNVVLTLPEIMEYLEKIVVYTESVNAMDGRRIVVVKKDKWMISKD